MINRNRSIILEEQPILDARWIHIKWGHIGAPGRSVVARNGLVGGNVIDKIIRRHEIIIVADVKLEAQLQLFEIVQACDAQCPAFGLGQNRQ